jgi:hypothetical protein
MSLVYFGFDVLFAYNSRLESLENYKSNLSHLNTGSADAVDTVSHVGTPTSNWLNTVHPKYVQRRQLLADLKRYHLCVSELRNWVSFVKLRNFFKICTVFCIQGSETRSY